MLAQLIYHPFLRDAQLLLIFLRFLSSTHARHDNVSFSTLLASELKT